MPLLILSIIQAALLAAGQVLLKLALRAAGAFEMSTTFLLAYVFGMLAALWVFGERISPTAWIGVLLIMAGCYLVTR